MHAIDVHVRSAAGGGVCARIAAAEYNRRVTEGSPRPMDDSHYTEEKEVGHQFVIMSSMRVFHANSSTFDCIYHC